MQVIFGIIIFGLILLAVIAMIVVNFVYKNVRKLREEAEERYYSRAAVRKKTTAASSHSMPANPVRQDPVPMLQVRQVRQAIKKTPPVERLQTVV